MGSPIGMSQDEQGAFLIGGISLADPAALEAFLLASNAETVVEDPPAVLAPAILAPIDLSPVDLSGMPAELARMLQGNDLGVVNFPTEALKPLFAKPEIVEPIQYEPIAIPADLSPVDLSGMPAELSRLLQSNDLGVQPIQYEPLAIPAELLAMPAEPIAMPTEPIVIPSQPISTEGFEGRESIHVDPNSFYVPQELLLGERSHWKYNAHVDHGRNIDHDESNVVSAVQS